jgi:hypothetical protein
MLNWSVVPYRKDSATNGRSRRSTPSDSVYSLLLLASNIATTVAASTLSSTATAAIGIAVSRALSTSSETSGAHISPTFGLFVMSGILCYLHERSGLTWED